MIDVGVQSHGGACIGCAAGLDAATNFGAIYRKEDHRLHAKRLDDVQSHREVGSIVAAIVSWFGDVLRPQTEGDLFSDKWLVAARTAGGNGQSDVVGNAHAHASAIL